MIVDDYSRFTWTIFLASKDESFDQFFILIKRLEKRIGHSLVSLRSDHGTKFEILVLLFIVMNMVWITTFRPLEHHNKMVLWKEKIEH